MEWEGLWWAVFTRSVSDIRATSCGFVSFWLGMERNFIFMECNKNTGKKWDKEKDVLCLIHRFSKKNYGG